MQTIDWMFGDALTDGSVVRFSVGTKTYGELWATVDFDDWPAINDDRWRATRRKNIFYVRNGQNVFLHRFLTGFEWPVVDHKDGDGLNNRRSNLRRCETNSENSTYGADRRRGCTKGEALLHAWIEKNAPELMNR